MTTARTNTTPIDQTNLILTLLRRGERIEKIAWMLNVKRADVERVMERYYARLA